jgi:hypothetical protein
MADVVCPDVKTDSFPGKSLMQAMLSDLEAAGSTFVGGSRVVSGRVLQRGGVSGFHLEVEDIATAERTAIQSGTLINAGGNVLTSGKAVQNRHLEVRRSQRTSALLFHA